jgi:hypothetical protein
LRDFGHLERVQVKISWVIAEGYQFDPAVDLGAVKDIGPIWGSWTTWRGCGTDNVVCNNRVKAQELLERGFQNGCNFYIPNLTWQELNRPTGVHSYGGEFEHTVQRTDDIVALHLAGSTADIVIMTGFKLIPNSDSDDPHYFGHVLSAIKQHPDTQWVIIDHHTDLDKHFQDLANLTCDTLGNVLQLLAQ